MKSLSSQKSSSWRKIAIISAVAITLLGAAAYIYYSSQRAANHNAELDTSTVKEEEVKPDADSQSQLPSKTENGSTTPTTPPTETPSTPPEKPVIERAGGSPTLKVVATLQKASLGSCELQLSAPGHQTKVFTSSIVVSTSYYICTFSIDRSSLPAGTWSATVVHRIGNASTNSDTRSVE